MQAGDVNPIDLLTRMADEAEREAQYQVVEDDRLFIQAKHDALREALRRLRGERPDHLWARRHPLLKHSFPL